MSNDLALFRSVVCAVNKVSQLLYSLLVRNRKLICASVRECNEEAACIRSCHGEMREEEEEEEEVTWETSGNDETAAGE